MEEIDRSGVTVKGTIPFIEKYITTERFKKDEKHNTIGREQLLKD